MFNELRNRCSIFSSSCTILHFYHQCTKISSFPNSFQHLFFWFFVVAILMCEKWYLTVVWILLSLLISDIEHLFILLLYLCIFFGEISIQVLCPFLIKLFDFSLLSYMHILNINPLLDIWFANISSHPEDSLYFLIDCVHCCTKVFEVWYCFISLFFFCCLCFWCYIQETVAKSHVMTFISLFSSRSFIVLGLTTLEMGLKPISS